MISCQHMLRHHVLCQILEQFAQRQRSVMKTLGQLNGFLDQRAVLTGMLNRSSLASLRKNGFLVLEVLGHVGRETIPHGNHLLRGDFVEHRAQEPVRTSTSGIVSPALTCDRSPCAT